MSYATIAAEAFEGCDYLREVVTPANMTSIGDRAFKSCKSLQELSIPQSKLKDIGKEAFSQCIKLQDVAIGNECGTIETSAFTGCVSLASLDRFSQDHAQYPFDIVGDYAFSNCGFKKLNLSLRSSTIYTFWGDNCFADNTSLEEVNFLSSCYMSTRMFANCKSLKNVNFKNNQTSYVYPYTFENCASLASITLPSKIWYVSEGMFHGCTALEEVKFTQYGAAESMVSLVQRNAFSGCSMLTSIDFPASLNTLDYFDDGCLSGIFKTATDSRGMTVRLHGMALHDMMQPAGQMLTADVKYGEVYTISVYFDDTCKASIEAYDPAKQLSTIMSFTDQTGQPLFILLNEAVRHWHSQTSASLTYDYETRSSDYANSVMSCISGSQLSNVHALFLHVVFVIADDDPYGYMHDKAVSLSADTQLQRIRRDYCTSIKNKDYDALPKSVQYMMRDSHVSEQLSDIMKSAFASSHGGYYGSCCYAYKSITDAERRRNGEYTMKVVYKSKDAIDVKRINDAIKRIDGNITQSKAEIAIAQQREFSDRIKHTGMLRLCHDCNVVDMNGATQVFRYDASKTMPYSPPAEYHVDDTTTEGFVTGTWYYNAEQLKKHADNTHTPCLFIYSLLGCKPCQVYQKSIWSNTSFQSWAKKQRFYLCGMEVTKQPYYDKQLEFCVNELSPNALNYLKAGQSYELTPNGFGQTFKQTVDSSGRYNSNLMTPVIVFYYNDGTQTRSFDYTFHNIDRDIADFGVDGVIQYMKSLCLYHFDNNDISTAKFTVDAVKAFNKYDYVTPDNPYQIADDMICIDSWKPLAGKATADNALAQMKSEIAAYTAGTTAAKYPTYIGGCIWSSIDWIARTYDTSTLELGTMTALEMNEQLRQFKVKIGSGVYYLQLDANSKKTNIDTPCDPSATIYKYLFSEVK